MNFNGTSVGIISFPALGDATLYLRLAWLFHRAGARVTLFSSTLFPAREAFPWGSIVPDQGEALATRAARFDLLIACFETCFNMADYQASCAALKNVAFVTAKKIPKESGVQGRGVIVRGHCFKRASIPFCADSSSRMTMVDWVDNYASSVYGIAINAGERVEISRALASATGHRVVIFPTTPQEKKNYWLTGFRLLGRLLQAQGWQVEFVCMPHELDGIANALPGVNVYAFPDVLMLMDYLSGARAVVSNDSGGGHLASLIDIPTFTITRRSKKFVWRPGFNQANTVIHPLWRFKWLGRYVWRPFVPVWRIALLLGKPL